MQADPDLLHTLMVVAIIIVSCSFHEMSHAWVAFRLGDPTGYRMGRITMNPLAHIDPFMSVILPAASYLMTGIPFGGAKPVPINHFLFRNPERGMALASAAGPVSNFILAAAGAGVAVILSSRAPEGSINAFLIWHVLFFWIVANVYLGVFNLVPIPPLDGSRVFRLLLPKEPQRIYDSLEPYGLVIVLFLVSMRALGPVLGPIGTYLLNPLFTFIERQQPL
ncbi:MAG: site-2 protease family protein [Planctomycetes bacterium]|nr:site-2 protease family protein [Planctomycetota bacterium]